MGLTFVRTPCSTQMETTMRLILPACISVLSLAACASDPTPREASHAYTEGYTQRPLSDDRYLIAYRMEGSDYQRAYDLALCRAAQVALERGYPAFEVVNRDVATDAGARHAFMLTTERGMSYQRSCGLLGCSTAAVPTEWTSIESATNGRGPSRVVSLEIRLSHDASGNSPNRYYAAEVVGALASRAHSQTLLPKDGR